jgi:hypothetical protein
MGLDDVLEPEVLIAVGVTAAIMSPPVRRVLRRGAVLGLAGLLVAGDKIVSAARGAAHGAQNLAASVSQRAQQAAGEERATAAAPA